MGNTPPEENLLTDRLLRSWIRCRRKAWLDRYGNSESRVWTAHRNLQLEHQQRSFVELMPFKPGKGIEACRKGSYGVLGLRLKGKSPSSQPLEAHPPLLQRIKGESVWGDYAYRPVLARQGRRLTKEHKLALSLTGLLLEPLQESKVNEGLAVSLGNKGLEIERINLNKGLQKQLLESLAKLTKDLKSEKAPPITSDRRKCTVCSWRGVCNAEAAEEGYLSEVSGIGARREQILQGLGITSLNDLAESNPFDLSKSLEEFGEQHCDIAMPLVAQAKAQRDRCCERLTTSIALPELTKAPGVLLYDIESDPDAHDDFLHGFIHLKHNNNNWDLQGAKYHPMLMLYEHGEELAWKRLKRKLSFYSDWPILHYGETEALSLCRIAQRQGADDAEIKALKSRLIDLHALVKRHWRLPLNSYGLKVVAGWVGFQWSQIGADGARALLWWRQWRGSGPKFRGSSQNLRRIFQYNQDDCLASWAVAEWLLKQDQ